MNRFQLQVSIEGHGYPILCLHGHPGSSRSMRVFTRHLSQRFTTIAPDLRGYGRSKTRENFVMTDHLDDLEAMLDRAGIERCLLLGWSLGGIIGMELAVRSPDRISGMILVGTSGRPWSDHPRVSLSDNVFTGIAALLNSLKPGWQWNIDTFAKRSLFRYLIQQHTREAYRFVADDAVYAFLNTSLAANRALNVALKGGYRRIQGYESIQCPALMLAGAADRHINAASSLETAQTLPHCDYIEFPNTAHFLPWEDPKAVLGAIDRWLDKHPAAINKAPA